MPRLNPPSINSGYFGDGKFRIDYSDLWNYYTFPQGQAIVKRNGAWVLEPAVALDGAQEYFLGGYQHTITDAKAAELTAAGFGAYISPDESTPVPPDEDPPGFGEGGFGEGGFGE
jgi:hypothetical protein